MVFTDLEGFTAFTARQGDEAALALLQDHYREAGPVIRREGGRLVKHIGDGLLCIVSGIRRAVSGPRCISSTPRPSLSG